MSEVDQLNLGIGGHQSTKSRTDEWLTPPYILKALGEFDLDPCAAVNQPWNTANNHFNVFDNGLVKPWSGRIWLNPPYGQFTERWLNRLASHGNGIALTFARTETRMFFDQVWAEADALLFLEGRLYFYNINGKASKSNAGAPSVLIAYGLNNVAALRDSDLKGAFVSHWATG